MLILLVFIVLLSYVYSYLFLSFDSFELRELLCAIDFHRSRLFCQNGEVPRCGRDQLRRGKLDRSFCFALGFHFS